PFQLRKRKMPGVLTTFHDGMVSLILLSAYYVRLSKEAISVMFQVIYTSSFRLPEQLLYAPGD
ncbi:hypothetical protein D7F66_06465, partial [Salmonella enterica subsp. enterica serovar Kentucky]|nr:hypothetical protein [Salmonella enterica subsp. enterica serovar Kentucky]